MNEPSAETEAGRALFGAHPRSFDDNHYVYPVVSRRAGGVSIGVNLNLDKVCNFDCVYCQVDRAELGEKEFLEIDRLTAELETTAGLAASGRLFEHPRFAHTPPSWRRLNDIAFSGDGEPTTYRNFPAVVAAAADVRRRMELDDVKLVLITNASMFHRDHVRRGLEILDANGGEIWAKLDAGSETFYDRIVRSAIPFRRILDNLRDAAQVRPLVIQSMFLRIEGQPPSPEEQDAYGDRLNEITAAGGRIKLVQLYTIARRPAVEWVSALSDDELGALADRVRRRTGLAVATYSSHESHAHAG